MGVYDLKCLSLLYETGRETSKIFLNRFNIRTASYSANINICRIFVGKPFMVCFGESLWIEPVKKKLLSLIHI